MVEVLIEPENAHSLLGASSCERWWNCPGSTRLIQECGGSRKSGIDAAIGKVAHTIAERKLSKLLGHVQSIDNCFIGAKFEVDGHVITVNDEIMDGVQVYIDLVKNLMTEYDLAPHHIQIEKRISIPGADPWTDGINTFNCFGTADLIVHVPFRMLIGIDYKNGFREVDIEENKQLMYYAVGAFYSLTPEERGELDEVSIYIVQPNGLGEKIKQFTFPISTLHTFHEALLEAIARVSTSNKLFAGEHCMWCPAKLNCKAYLGDVAEQAGINFQAPVPIDDVIMPVNMTPEQLGNILNYEKRVMECFKLVRSHAQALEEQGVDVPGYKVVEKYGNRQWSKDPKIIVDSLKLKGLTESDIFNEPKLKSPNQIEEAARARLKIKKKDAETFTADLWEKPFNGKTLVADSDKRQEIAPTLTTQFADLKQN